MTTMTLERPLQKQPSVLRGLPLVGNLIPLSRDILKFVQQAVRNHEALVEVQLMGASFYIATHPALIEEVYASVSVNKLPRWKRRSCWRRSCSALI